MKTIVVVLAGATIWALIAVFVISPLLGSLAAGTVVGILLAVPLSYLMAEWIMRQPW